MSWDFDSFDDGDTLDAAALNAALLAGQTWLNAIDASGINRGCFGNAHGVNALRTFGSNYKVTGDGSGDHVYDQTPFGNSMVYQGHGTDDGSDTGGNLGTGGWSIIGHPSATGAYAGPTAALSLNASFRVGMSNGSSDSLKAAGLLVFANANLEQATVGEAVQMSWATCIQFQLNGTGTWYTIERSERFWDLESLRRAAGGSDLLTCDGATIEYIGPNIIDDVGTASSDELTGIRFMHCMRDLGGAVNRGGTITLNRWNLHILPVFSADMAGG